MEGLRILAVARGDEPADLVIHNGRIINVFTGEILKGSIAIAEGRIAAVGEDRQALLAFDAEGRYLAPGLIDAHVHLESSMVTPYEYARAVVPHGTTTVVCDPHEIANVAGEEGVRWVLDASEGLPLDVLVSAPSCVPASHLATSGAELDAAALARLRAHPRVVALAEVMNVPGAVCGDPTVQSKIQTYSDRPIDGHAPGLGGPWLQAYAALGIGSDHECISADEARAKLRLGMRVFLREGTGARNLLDLLPAVTPQSCRRCAFCTDDRHPHDLLDEGHIDHLVRLAVAEGLDPMSAIQLATVNAAEAFGLRDRGALTPGRRADIVVFEDLQRLSPHAVFSPGRCVALEGKPTGPWPKPEVPHPGAGHLDVDLNAIDLTVRLSTTRVRVIGIVPGQITTEALVLELPRRDGQVTSDRDQDVAKLAVIERHRGSNSAGLGFVQGLGLRSGALASTVAHDHHNLIVAGMDDDSMAAAAAAVIDNGGGLAVADRGQALAALGLPIGGLMSLAPIEELRARLDELLKAACGLGCRSQDPFMVLSFLGLEVIPALRLTDLGVIDVTAFRVVPLAASS